MEKRFDINELGYSVRCILYYNKDIHEIKDVVIATYGFGGTKENKATAKFAERLVTKYKGFGVICFDWPCHGADARKKLILEECITYLQLAIDYAKNEMKAENLYTYTTSFGGFITLKYIAEHKNPFRKIAMRCPAIKMYDIMVQSISEEDMAKLEKGKEIMAGHDRMLKINRQFLEDLKASDIRNNDYIDYADDILILQGTKDEMVSIEDTKEFAENNVIEMIPVENADHPFSNPSKMDFAIQKCVEFFG